RPRAGLRLSCAGVISTQYRRARVRILRALAQPDDVQGLRILCFHRVGYGRDALAVSPSRFQQHMRWLLECGAKPVRLTEMLEKLRKPIDGRHVCITFDDGYRDLLDHAVPVLRELRLPATVFLPTHIIDGAETYYWQQRPAPALTWSDVLALQEEGI